MEQDGKIFQFDRLYGSNLGGIARNFEYINLYQIGETSCMNGYEISPHTQWCHEISYVISGEGLFTTDGDTSLLTEGNIHFCPKGSTHSIKVTGNSDFRYGYIGFSFEDMPKGEDAKLLKKYYEELNRYTAVDNNNVLPVFFRCLDELYTDSDFSGSMVATSLLQMLVLVYRSFEEQPRTEYLPDMKAIGSKRMVFNAIRYIESHIFDEISVKQIADYLGYNFSYLSNEFRISTGLTISQYISKIKIKKSIELMQNGKFSVGEVAERLNFSSSQAFNKAFKRNLNVSPTDFIKKRLNNKS